MHEFPRVCLPCLEFVFDSSLLVFQPTQQQTRYRKSPYAPANGEGIVLFSIHFQIYKCFVLILSFTLFVLLDGGSSPSEDSPSNE